MVEVEESAASVPLQREEATAVVVQPVEQPFGQLLKLVDAVDDQAKSTSLQLAAAGLVLCGIGLVLLPPISVFWVGGDKFPAIDYIVTSVIGAILVTISVIAVVVVTRGRSQDKAAVATKVVDMTTLEQLKARSNAVRNAALPE